MILCQRYVKLRQSNNIPEFQTIIFPDKTVFRHFPRERFYVGIDCGSS